MAGGEGEGGGEGGGAKLIGKKKSTIRECTGKNPPPRH